MQWRPLPREGPILDKLRDSWRVQPKDTDNADQHNTLPSQHTTPSARSHFLCLTRQTTEEWRRRWWLWGRLLADWSACSEWFWQHCFGDRCWNQHSGFLDSYGLEVGSGGLLASTLSKAGPANVARGLVQHSFEDFQGWRFLLVVSDFRSSIWPPSWWEKFSKYLNGIFSVITRTCGPLFNNCAPLRRVCPRLCAFLWKSNKIPPWLYLCWPFLHEAQFLWALLLYSVLQLPDHLAHLQWAVTGWPDILPFVHISSIFSCQSSVSLPPLPRAGIMCEIHPDKTNRDFWKELGTPFPFHINHVSYLIKALWEAQAHSPTQLSSSRNPGSWSSPGKNHTDRQRKLESAKIAIVTAGCFLPHALGTLLLCWQPLIFQVKAKIFVLSITIVLFSAWSLHAGLSWSELLMFFQSCQHQMHIFLESN